MANMMRGAYNMPENNGVYARYLQQLDELADKRRPVAEQADNIAKRLNPSASPSPRPVVMVNKTPTPKRPRTPLKPASASKDQQIAEFRRRNEEFQRNKAKGQAAYNNPILPQKPPVLVKRDEKAIYEEKLRKIREQNYANRKAIENRRKVEVIENYRQKRLAALKLQSEEQRLKNRNDLDKRRFEAYEKEQRAQVPMAGDKVNPKPQQVIVTPRQPTPIIIKAEPSINMTEVFNAIGFGVVGKKISKDQVLRNPDESSSRPESARRSWSKGTSLSELENKSFVKSGNEPATPRKFWGSPHDSVIKGFELVQISDSVSSTLVPVAQPNSSTSENTCEKLDSLEKTLKKINDLFTPDKLATLKATKNLILEVTLGKFDSKNTKVTSI